MEPRKMIESIENLYLFLPRFEIYSNRRLGRLKNFDNHIMHKQRTEEMIIKKNPAFDCFHVIKPSVKILQKKTLYNVHGAAVVVPHQ